jgi:hypothetical protein
VLIRVGLPTASVVGRASSTAIGRPGGRRRLLMSRRGAVCRWGPRGGGGWAGGRPEAAGDELGGARRSGVVRCRGATRHCSGMELRVASGLGQRLVQWHPGADGVVATKTASGSALASVAQIGGSGRVGVQRCKQQHSKAKHDKSRQSKARQGTTSWRACRRQRVEVDGRWRGSMAARGGRGDEAMARTFKRWVRLTGGPSPLLI